MSNKTHAVQHINAYKRIAIVIFDACCNVHKESCLTVRNESCENNKRDGKK